MCIRDSLLGASPKTIGESLERMSNKDFNNVKQGFFQVYAPSENVIKGMFRNAQKIGAPNAWLRVRGIINSMARKLSRIRTNKGSKFPDLFNPLKKTIETIDQQGNLIPPNQPIQTSEVSEEVVQTSALPSNINQDTGLTSTEEALLSPTEKALRRRQRNVTG